LDETEVGVGKFATLTEISPTPNTGESLAGAAVPVPQGAPQPKCPA
jgi:hypothetical protein